MNRRDLRRWQVLEQVLEKKVRQVKAAEILELTDRQIRRLVKRVGAGGAKGLLHRARGRESNRRHCEGFRQQVLGIYRKRYEGFGPTLAVEKMLEREKIRIGRETLRQWLIEEGLWEGKRKAQKHREWRERRECFGEMIQMDGSHHDWLEGRGPKLVLMGYIDDATGHVFARFYDYEGTMPAMDSFYHYTKRYGLPHELYLDKHSTYKGWGKLTVEEDLAGREAPVSEFGRAMEELGVKLIHAGSPQAKGRIERLFGTFQDRLIKEMRLAGIKSKEEANQFLQRYLPIYNRRFDKKARSQANLHRKPPKDLKQALSIQTRHCLRQDHTIRHQGKFYQILERWAGHRPKEVRVEERLDGKLYITREGRELQYRRIQEPPQRFPVPKKKPSKARRVPIPMTHPYKRRSFERYLGSLKTKVAA